MLAPWKDSTASGSRQGRQASRKCASPSLFEAGDEVRHHTGRALLKLEKLAAYAVPHDKSGGIVGGGNLTATIAAKDSGRCNNVVRSPTIFAAYIYSYGISIDISGCVAQWQGA